MTPWKEACQASLSFTMSQSLLKLMFIELVMSSNHLILCGPLLLLPSVFPSIRIFSNELNLCIRWPKYWSFSIGPSSEYSGVISFRIDWLTSLLSKGLSRVFSSTTVQKHQFGSRPSLCPVLTSVHDCWAIWPWLYGPLTEKWGLLLFNMLSRFVIAFLPRSKHLLISCLQSPSVVILETKKIKSVTVSTFPPSTFHDT